MPPSQQHDRTTYDNFTQADILLHKPKAGSQISSHRQHKSLSLKTLPTRPNIVSIYSLLAYVAISFLIFSGGSATLERYGASRLHHAQRELQVYTSTIDAEHLLYTQIDELLDSQLARAPLESYEQCLARGLLVAERKVFQVGFLYPDIRVQVMGWTEDNCNRLNHSPQVRNVPKEQLILTWWAKKAHHSRQLLQTMASFITQSAKRVWCHTLGRILSASCDDSSPSACDEIALASGDFSKFMDEKQRHAAMPFGFELNCIEGQLCRLMYPVVDSASFKRTVVLPQTSSKLQHRVLRLSWAGTFLRTTSTICGALAAKVRALRFCTMIINVLIWLSTSRPQRGVGLNGHEEHFWYNMQYKEMSLILGSIFIEQLGVRTFGHGLAAHDEHKKCETARGVYDAFSHEAHLDTDRPLGQGRKFQPTVEDCDEQPDAAIDKIMAALTKMEHDWTRNDV
ncbi:hypothetical protein T440DRAFT_554254 [Plenodomus tracheiphilus IPT5]|uniref:Uncharacterized protein n=1 Tax=Plenodomus tracheiphilus IPT5 TaxID=1408161 RepID=A0A6A7BBX0_9PLEO|nr:hypothetical protein T440DRAFT_554254 [Plenodomus tracheiphilus IPT5]